VRISRVGNKVVLEPIYETFDVDAQFARLDELGARDFFLESSLEDLPPEPDEAVSFD
jgi:antitoxin VapB